MGGGAKGRDGSKDGREEGQGRKRGEDEVE